MLDFLLGILVGVIITLYLVREGFRGQVNGMFRKVGIWLGVIKNKEVKTNVKDSKAKRTKKINKS